MKLKPLLIAVMALAPSLCFAQTPLASTVTVKQPTAANLQATVTPASGQWSFLSTSANQTTELGYLSSIVSNTANIPSSPSTAGNQSTEISNLSTIATNTGASATSANQTNVQSAAGTPATTLIGVQGNSSGVPIPTDGSYQTNAVSVTAAGGGTSYPLLGQYTGVSFYLAANYVGASSINGQFSNDNTNWQTFTPNTNGGGGGGSSFITTGDIYTWSTQGLYFRLLFNGTRSSGTTTGTLVFTTAPIVPQSVAAVSSQSGTWTVQQGSTPSSTPWLFTNTPTTTSGYTYYHFSDATATTGTASIISGAHNIHTISLNGPCTGTCILYDNTAASGTVFATLSDTIYAGPSSLTYDANLTTGLYASLTSFTGDVTITYK